MEAIDHKYSNEELVDLIQNSKNKELSKYYYELLWENNHNLLFRLAFKFKGVSYLSLDDLLQEAYLGMIKSVEFYDNKLSPFVNFMCLIVMQWLFCKCNGTNNKNKAIKKNTIKTVSLQQPVIEDEEGRKQTIADILPSLEAQQELDKIPEAIFIDSLHEAELNAINTMLTPREKQVLLLYYFGDDNSKSYNTLEISELLNISKPRICECLQLGHRKLRKDAELRKFYKTEFEWR